MRRNKTLNLREINTTYWRRQHSWERNTQLILVGLSKERPILGDHAKAHIFGLRSENTPIKPRRSTWKAHEKRRFSKDHLQGIVTLCLLISYFFIILNSDWQHVTFGKIRQMTLFAVSLQHLPVISVVFLKVVTYYSNWSGAICNDTTNSIICLPFANVPKMNFQTNQRSLSFQIWTMFWLHT